MSTLLSPALVIGRSWTGEGVRRTALGRRYGVAPPSPSTAPPWSRPSLRNGTVRQPVREPASRTTARTAQHDRERSNPRIARRHYRLRRPFVSESSLNVGDRGHPAVS